MNDELNLNINPVDNKARDEAQRYLDSLAKPLGSLGRLEEIYLQLAGIMGKRPDNALKKRILVFCADNGVYARGISPVPQSVTLVQGRNISLGITGMGRLAKCADADIVAYDVGINAPSDKCAPLINKKLMMGTDDFTQGPAMSCETAITAINIGINAAKDAASDGVTVIGVGEMGICNTCSSAAVLSALTGASSDLTVGKGAGLTQAQFDLKRECVSTALNINRPNPNDPVDVLSKVGGLDICAMVGTYLGAAESHMAAVVDGFIGMVAASCAVRIAPNAAEYLIPSHRSAEPAFMLAAETAGLNPPLDLGMRLGEGSGCPLMMQIIDSAVYALNTMVTFDGAEIDSSDYIDIRK